MVCQGQIVGSGCFAELRDLSLECGEIGRVVDRRHAVDGDLQGFGDERGDPFVQYFESDCSGGSEALISASEVRSV
ncbi:hypothetical protein ADL12_40120 [Streptomyces regalis]|uniref:Uncharacterized protein n=1 Tax=Streptomyces regalis TaxID=68262 RepID=A0A117ML30_9ACTN|nr:hypothetical protein ADL12_40120 [Streptomyces regalis]